MAKEVIQPSLAAGEISPQLYSRVDFAKFHTAVATLSNFFVDFRGGVSNRCGLQFINQAKSSLTAGQEAVRLFPFQFSTIQTYVLEFGHLYMRVIMNGGYVLNAAKVIGGITNANPGVVSLTAHGFDNGDWIYITGVGGMPRVNNRYYIVMGVTTSTFQLRDPNLDNVNTTDYGDFIVGGTAAEVFTLATPYVATDLARLKYTQSADVMTLTHPAYSPRDLSRTGHASWTLTVVNFGSKVPIPQNVNQTTAPAGTGPVRLSYRITAVTANGEESLPSKIIKTSIPSTGLVDVLLFWNPVADIARYNVYRAALAGTEPFYGDDDTPTESIYGYLATTQAPKYVDTWKDQVPVTVPDFSKAPPEQRNPFAPGSILSIDIGSVGTGHTDGTTIAVTDSTGSGAILRAVVHNGTLIAAVVEKGGANYTNPSFDASPGTGATMSANLSPASGTYPATVTYFQQRRIFGGSTVAPQTLWASKTGAFRNFDVSFPIRDDDAITATLVGSQVNDIRLMVAMPAGLIVGTGLNAWQVNGGGGGQGQPITPLNILAQPQSYNGFSHVPPINVNYDLLYVQDKASTVRALSYNFYYNAYSAANLSLLSEHLLTGKEILEWAYAEEPFKIVWSVKNDGGLLSMTYVKDQELIGWGRHSTSGAFESVCSISENEEDAVYFVVRRTVNGHTVRYVERMFSRAIDHILDSRFLDSALVYEGPPTTTLSGLDHLEGRTVTAFADASIYAGLVVTDGQVTLPVPQSVVIVGIPFISDLKSLPLDIKQEQLQGRRKNIKELGLRVAHTRGLLVGATFSTLVPSKSSTTPITIPESQRPSHDGTWTNGLFSGDDSNLLDSTYSVYGQICVRQDKPFPVTITGLILSVEPGDK